MRMTRLCVRGGFEFSGRALRPKQTLRPRARACRSSSSWISGTRAVAWVAGEPDLISVESPRAVDASRVLQ